MGPGRCGTGSHGPPSTLVGRRDRTSGVLLFLLSLVCLIHISSYAGAEPIHHSRSYKDEFGLEPPRRVFGVKTFEQGLEYLVKYGWVNCSLNTGGSGRNALTDMLMEKDPETQVREGVATRPMCTSEEAQKGYVAMQQYYKLPETGTLDDNTLRLMNSKRCGNRDSGNDENKDEEEKANNASTKASTRVRRAAVVEIERRKAEEEREKRKLQMARGSLLMGRLLTQTQTSKTKSVIRRAQMLAEYTSEFQKNYNRKSSSELIFQSARTRIPTKADPYEKEVKKRKKRSAMVTISSSQYEVFNKASDECVTWRIPSICYSRRIPADEQRGIVKLAFRMWSEVIPLCFEEQRDGPISDVDIQICFAKDTHLNCQIPFDGNGGELAHSWKLGNIHFDDAENYRPNGNGGINLLKVAVHEIGHVLGLNHTQRNYSVMYSIYIGVPIQQDFELGWEDRKDVQRFYGVCKGSFDTVFDYIRQSLTQGLIYNTYFFRYSRYWMYENRYNRTRYGDPLIIANEWKGLPPNVQAYAQVILWNRMETKWNINTYFFKGNKFYIYDSETDSVEKGLKISDHFGPKNESSEPIPNNLDSVYFELHTRKLQFFKGDWVYIYDPAAGTNRCCEQKIKFTDLYPTTEGKQLTGDVNAVYFSHTFRKQYFFKGEDIWVNEGGKNGIPHRLRYQEKWFNNWYDICDAGHAKALNLGAEIESSSEEADADT